MTLTTARLIAIAGTTRDALNKIMDPARGGLRTPVPATLPGVARTFSRENGLEVAFIVALGRVGIPSVLARHFAYAWVEKDRVEQLAPYWAWNPRTDASADPELSQLEFSQDIPFVDLAFMLADSGPSETALPAASLVAIDRAEIVRRIAAAI